MANANIHVVLNGDVWEVQEEGKPESTEKFVSQAAAMVAGRELAKKNKVEFIAHGKDGSIKVRDSY